MKFAWDAYVIGLATGLLFAVIVMPYSFIGWFLFFAAAMILGVVYAFVLRKEKGEKGNGEDTSGD